MCKSTNVVGEQKEACIFHIIAAGRFGTTYKHTATTYTHTELSKLIFQLANNNFGMPRKGIFKQITQKLYYVPP